MGLGAPPHSPDSPLAPGHPHRGRLRRIRSLTRAELLAAARDPQVLLYTVVLPLALYPVLLWVLLQGRALLAGREEQRAVRVGVVGSVALVERLEADLRTTDDASLAHPGPLVLERVASAPEDARAFLSRPGAPDLLWSFDGVGSSLTYVGTSSRARLGRVRLEERLGPVRERLRAQAFDAAGGRAGEREPFQLESVDLADADALSRSLFALLLPLTFVLMAVFGAFYPAVDATCGERERGTLETTRLAPIPAVELLVSKLLAIVVGAGIATALNLLGLALAAEPLLGSLDPDRAVVVPWGRLLLALPLCAGFLGMVSALLYALAANLQTFKQGQALLGPVQLGFLAPAVLGVLPGFDPGLGGALVPVLGTVLAFRRLLEGDPGTTWPFLLLAAFAQLLWMLPALWLALRAGRDRDPASPALRLLR